jgi:O-acetyl-ADP-ribose deacetylase (regulator of RNase III)
MPFRIVRNDITKMETDAIVNTANDYPTVGTGCRAGPAVSERFPI